MTTNFSTTGISYALQFDSSLTLPVRNDGTFFVAAMGPDRANALQGCSKLAIFDFDGTLGIPTQCLLNCPTIAGCNKQGCPPLNWAGYREWQPTFKTIPQTFAGLIERGYKIAIISNQPGLNLSRGAAPNLYKRDQEAKTITQKRQDFLDKTQELVRWCNINFDITLTVVGLCGKNVQKPSPLGFELYNTLYNGNVPVNCRDSFYCGDAAGRTKDNTTDRWQKGADTFGQGYIDSDKVFALNIGVKFFTPEEMFMSDQAGYPRHSQPPNIFQAGLLNQGVGRASECHWNNGYCLNTAPPPVCGRPYYGPYRGASDSALV